MKSYDSRNWLNVFTLYKQDTLRKLWLPLFLLGIYTVSIDYWFYHDIELRSNPVFKNLSIVHSLLGLVISLLLVFRTNTAYDRWWEGRKLWGTLVNGSRNLAIKLNGMLAREDQANRKFFRNFIPLYAKALDVHLKSRQLEFQLDEIEHPELESIQKEKHLPNQIAVALINRIYNLQKEGILSKEQLLLINPEITTLTDVCGACERIKNTPIPYSYSSFIKKFILLYILTLPWSLFATLGYWSIAVVLMVFFALSSLEVIAEEIEEPFGADANDLPTEQIANNIQKNIGEII